MPEEDNTHKVTQVAKATKSIASKASTFGFSSSSHGKEAKEVQAVPNPVFLRVYKRHLQLPVFIPCFASSMASLDALCDRIPQWSTRELDK